METKLLYQPLDRVEADAVAVVLFEDEAAPAELKFASAWLDELRASSEFVGKSGELAVLHQPQGVRAKRIVVAGGTARVPGLVDLLREEFAMPVEELNPFRKVLINPSRHSDDQIRELAPRLVIAVGLALRSFD